MSFERMPQISFSSAMATGLAKAKATKNIVECLGRLAVPAQTLLTAQITPYNKIQTSAGDATGMRP